MPNGLAVQKMIARDFLYPDADERYVPKVLAYVHDWAVMPPHLQAWLDEEK